MRRKIPIKLAGAATVLTFLSLWAQAAEVDALAIDSVIQARHLPFGTILNPIMEAPGSSQIAGYTRCGDSAIWTGHYLAAEAFRYQVTQSSDALNNVRSAIAGIESLVDVTGTGLLARCLVPANSPFAAGIESEEASNGIYRNNSTGYIWVGNTSRDQYSGVMFGLATAYDMVPDSTVRASTVSLVTRLIDFLQNHAWTIVMPDGTISTTFVIRPDQILTFLRVGSHVNPSLFSFTYDVQSVLLAAGVIAPILVDTASDDSYFKFNLDYINAYTLIRLDNSAANSVYREAYDILRAHTAGHQNAFFDMIQCALNGPNAPSETLPLLEQWLQRSRFDDSVNLNGIVAACGTQACQPVPVQLRPPGDFLWQDDPFVLSGGGSGVIETAGIDYILPYWMARHYGIASAMEVRSAAAPSLVVTPDSIGLVYGANLASATQGTALQPPPLTLGGVTLVVTDAAGTRRPAPLMYVSPVQINFIVPAGTVPGNATFTVANGALPAVTVSGTVQSVAPTLFSMNGDGTGAAAATALRVQASNPGLQSPVQVFQCNATGCVATPIQLGVDTPVYLALYGTGIRNRSALSNVQVTVNGIAVPVLYAGPQPTSEGLDQVNVELPLTLIGSGESNVVLSVDGQFSNPVSIDIM